MEVLEIAVRTSADKESALAIVGRVDAFAAASADIVSVTSSDGLRRRKWTIRFRDKVFSWTESVEFGSAGDLIEFVQTDGDFRRLSGSWKIEPAAGGCLVRYHVRIDIGVPIFDRIVEPLVARVLGRSIVDVLVAILPDAVPVAADAETRDPERYIATYVAGMRAAATRH